MSKGDSHERDNNHLGYIFIGRGYIASPDRRFCLVGVFGVWGVWIMTNEELQSITFQWKRILRLQDWHTNVGFARAFEMPYATAGNNSYRAKLKRARIDIIDPDDIDPSHTPEDPEATLVHELLHCHTAAFDNQTLGQLSPAQEFGMEQMVEAIAQGFVELKRERDKAYLQGKLDQITLDIEAVKGKKK